MFLLRRFWSRHKSQFLCLLPFRAALISRCTFLFLPLSCSVRRGARQQQYFQICNIVYQIHILKITLCLNQGKSPRCVFLTSSLQLAVLTHMLCRWTPWNDCATLHTLAQHKRLSLLNSLRHSGQSSCTQRTFAVQLLEPFPWNPRHFRHLPELGVERHFFSAAHARTHSHQQ